MQHRFTAILLACAITSVTPATAQAPARWSVQAAGVMMNLYGETFDGLDNGYGGEVQLRYAPGRLSWGIGVQRSSHGSPDYDGEKFNITSVFVEPRLTLDVGSKTWTPYLAGRAGYSRQGASFDFIIDHVRSAATTPSLAVRDDAPLLAAAAAPVSELKSTGYQGSIGAGVMARLTPRVSLDVGALVGVMHFGDAKYYANGKAAGQVNGSAGTGQNLTIHAGLSIGFGASR